MKKWENHTGYSQEYCNEIFHYENGTLVRKSTVSQTAKKGDIAGTKASNGYRTVVIKGKRTCLHRVIFLMHHGFLPKIVDHINGIKDDNRIENLRKSDYSKNGFSHRATIKNKSSAFRGVSFIKRDKRWQAKVKLMGKTISFGYFKDEIEAAKAYDKGAYDIAGDHAILNFPIEFHKGLRQVESQDSHQIDHHSR